MTKLPMAELQRISKIIMDLEPLADMYERHGRGSFKVCFELLAEYRALKSRLLGNQLQKLKISDVYRRTFTGTFVGDRQALLKVGPPRMTGGIIDSESVNKPLRGEKAAY